MKLNAYISRFKLLLVLLFITIALLVLKSPVSAKSYFYDEIEIDYYINKDSTVFVEERYKLRFEGDFRGVNRSITLADPKADELCKSDPTLQCGGFDFMYLDKVWGRDGKELDSTQYVINEQDVSYNGSKEKRIDIRYQFSELGEFFSNEKFTWGIRYKVFGSIGFFDTYDLIYWDSIFADRDTSVNKVRIKIHLPAEFEFKSEDIRFPASVHRDSIVKYSGGIVTIESPDPIMPNDPYTFLLKVPKGMITQPGNIKLNLKYPNPIAQIFGSAVIFTYENRDISNSNNEYRGIPAGEARFSLADESGNKKDFSVNIEPGKTTEVEFSPQPSLITMLLSLAFILCNLCGCIALPLAIIIPINRYRKNQEEQRYKGPVIPIFSPPNGVTPSLLGSLKDEQVDNVDITSTIIDAGYKGYIKIKELSKGGSDFELTKLKDFSDLPKEELKILESIFGAKDKVTTNELKNTFYKKIESIENTIYDEMISKGFFKDRPDMKRKLNVGGGIAAMFGAIFLFVFIAIISAGVGLLFIGSTTVAIFIFGLISMFLGYIMKNKTPEGIKVLQEILGFRMYLYTAERFRMQKLTPEMFEKFLSYAIVFGIEKEWADKFKDIYTGSPDWYESYDQSIPWTPYLVSNSLGRFNTMTSNIITSRPASKSSGWSGSGWSGGGGFSGGFSGGGAGGGGGGAW